jgi:murein DD-endopeptidase MepM/ murein hydrolase activator NlpD
VNSAGWLALLLAALLVSGGALLWSRAEGTVPSIDAPDALLVGTAGASVALALADAGSGLRALRVDLVHAGGAVALLAEDYPGNLLSGGVRTEHAVQLELEPERLAEIASDAVLRIAVRDWSWRGVFRGNESVRQLPVSVDLQPPYIEISTGLTYAKQGGSGAVAYRVSEPPARDGVQVGEHFFAGFPRLGGRDGERVALFAIPTDVSENAPVAVVVEDAAGNTSRARWPLVVKRRRMPDANVTLKLGFLENVVPRFFDRNIDSAEGLVAAFDEINTRVRGETEARVRGLLTDSATEFISDARLQQLRSSKVTSVFGERRTYFFEGRPVSSAIHYGYDLASFAAAPVTTAAAGRVVYAGKLGIYGNCVLVDHGLGLATLYGHLSRLDVAAGKWVEQGQRLGLSGDTGLAGGDHLHFAVLVGETYVDPLEWWDARWMQTHIYPRLHASRP